MFKEVWSKYIVVGAEDKKRMRVPNEDTYRNNFYTGGGGG